tara:strand:- start:1452 stop:1937 length:486 start_codon:yes stop_codon:yes gene_type:complete
MSATRFSEDAFKRYEAVIAAIVDKYPHPSNFSPQPFSPETFSHRLRDAIKAHKRNHFPSQLVDWDKFQKCAIVVRMVEDRIVAGGRKETASANGIEIESSLVTNSDVIKTESIDVCRALAILLHHRIIDAATVQYKDNLEFLEEEFDLSISVNPDGTQLML